MRIRKLRMVLLLHHHPQPPPTPTHLQQLLRLPLPHNRRHGLCEPHGRRNAELRFVQADFKRA